MDRDPLMRTTEERLPISGMAERIILVLEDQKGGPLSAEERADAIDLAEITAQATDQRAESARLSDEGDL